MRPKLHPACEAFPALPQTDLKELADDIRKHGLIEPVTLLDGLLLDGRCRWDACELVGIEPRTVEFDGADPIAFVLSKNRHRRHLSNSQRAMAIARLATLSRGGQKDNANAAKTNGVADTIRFTPHSVEELSKQSGVSTAAIRWGKVVLKAEPHVIDMVDHDEVNVRVAAEAVRNTPRAAQVTWSKADVKREGKKVIDAYPSNQRKGNARSAMPAKPAKSTPSRTVHVPYGFCEFPTREESGSPPPGCPVEDRIAFIERYGRVPLHPKRVKDLMIAEGLIDSLVVPIRSAASKLAPDADAFVACIEDMLTYVPVPGKTDGSQRDFAKIARTALASLERDLPVAIERLTQLQKALQQRAPSNTATAKRQYCISAASP